MRGRWGGAGAGCTVCVCGRAGLVVLVRDGCHVLLLLLLSMVEISWMQTWVNAHEQGHTSHPLSPPPTRTHAWQAVPLAP